MQVHIMYKNDLKKHNIKFRIPWKFNFYLDDPESTVSYGSLKEFTFEEPSLKAFNALCTIKEQFLLRK